MGFAEGFDPFVNAEDVARQIETAAFFEDGDKLIEFGAGV